MNIAVISDIHGNVIALEAVLHDIMCREADLIFCLGDLVGYGAFPNEVIEVIRRNRIPTIMGNYDDGVGYDREECGCAYKDPRMAELGRVSLAWTKTQVTSENKSYLQGLLHRLEFTLYNQQVLLVHGSPRRLNEYLFEDRPDESLLRIMTAENATFLCCGHTHLPYVKNLNRRFLINPGSVGKPKDGDPRSAYALLTLETALVGAEIIRVEYDVGAAAKAIESAGLPREFADALRYGRG